MMVGQGAARGGGAWHHSFSCESLTFPTWSVKCKWSPKGDDLYHLVSLKTPFLVFQSFNFFPGVNITEISDLGRYL